MRKTNIIQILIDDEDTDFFMEASEQDLDDYLSEVMKNV